MDHGCIVFEGTPAALKANEAVRKGSRAQGMARGFENLIDSSRWHVCGRPPRLPYGELVKGVSAGEVVPVVEVVGSVSRAEVKFERVKVTVVVMMTVHCHRRGRQHK